MILEIPAFSYTLFSVWITKTWISRMRAFLMIPKLICKPNKPIIRGISMPTYPYRSNIISYSDSVNSFSGKLHPDKSERRLHSASLNRPELLVYIKSILTGSYQIFIATYLVIPHKKTNCFLILRNSG